MYLYTNSRVLAERLAANEFERREGVVAYWRKANAIHGWLVDHCQGGKDDCMHHEVTVRQLMRLRADVGQVLDSTELVDGEVVTGRMLTANGIVETTYVSKVLKDATVAKALLPVRGGFFFGSTAYDERYWADLTDTKSAIDAILAELAKADTWFDDWEVKGDEGWNVRFQYRSSW